MKRYDKHIALTITILPLVGQHYFNGSKDQQAIKIVSHILGLQSLSFSQSLFSCLSYSGFEVNSPYSLRNPENVKIIFSASNIVHRRCKCRSPKDICKYSSLTAMVTRIFLEALEIDGVYPLQFAHPNSLLNHTKCVNVIMGDSSDLRPLMISSKERKNTKVCLP